MTHSILFAPLRATLLALTCTGAGSTTLIAQAGQGCSGLLPEAIASFGAARCGDWLYVYGGHIGRAHQHSRDNLTGKFRRILLAGLDRPDAWEELPGGTPLQSVALVAHEGSLYRVGGMTAHNAPGAEEELESRPDFQRFDPKTRSWQALTPLPQARSSHDAFVIGSKLYVVGGWTLAPKPKRRTWLACMHVCDLGQAPIRWEEIEVPFRRRALVAGRHQDQLWVLGGLNAKGRPSKQVDVFDTRSGKWSRGPGLPFRGFAAGCTNVGNQLVASGWDSPLYRLASDGASWEKVRSLTTPRFFHRTIPLEREHCLVLGGAGASGHLRTLERLDIRPEVRQPRWTTWTLSTSAQARNRQGVFLHRGTIHAVGGNKSLGQHAFEEANFQREGWRINLGTMEARPSQPFPISRQSMTVVKDPTADRYLALGGFGFADGVARSFADGFAFGSKRGDWATSPAVLPETRTQFGVAAFGDKVYVFGGTDFDPRRGKKTQFRYPLEVVAFDPASTEGFAATGIELTHPRRAFGCATVAGRCYLIGGMGPGFKLDGKCEAFDFESQTWSTVAAPPHPWLSPQVAVLHGRIYATGGSVRGEDGKLRLEQSLRVYDPSEDSWSVVVERLPTVTKHARLLAYGDCLVVYSAHHAEPNTLTITAVHPELP